MYYRVFASIALLAGSIFGMFQKFDIGAYLISAATYCLVKYHLEEKEPIGN